MPIPKPRAKETQKDFISRCVSNDTMQEDYPDQKTRLGACFTSWEKEKKLEKQKYKVWSKDKAKKWLKGHDFKVGTYEKMANYHSFRQTNPDKYYRFRADKSPFNFKVKDGVIVIYGVFDKDGISTTEIQTIRFYHGEKDKKGVKDMDAKEDVAIERDGEIKILVSPILPADAELQMITISARLGIKALYSLTRKIILEYYFNQYQDYNWTAEKASEWYKDNKSIKPQSEKQIKRFFKLDEEKRIVYGVVLIPWEVDLQGDIMTDEEVEKAAHKYVESFQSVDEMHVISGVGTLLESYIAPLDFWMGGVEVVKGSWILVTRAEKAVWKKIKDGELVGYSIGYVGKRTPKEA